jgi:hypothetical protein
MTERKRRFPWVLLLIGLIVGAGGGVWYAWFLNPVNLVDVDPGQLGPEDQRAYVLLVSEAYLQDLDLDRARSRLEPLRARDLAQLVSDQADRALLNGDDAGATRALATLAEALGGNPLAAEVFSGTAQPTNSVSEAITATFSGVPTVTPTLEQPTETPTLLIPTATATPDFLIETELELIALEQVCEDDYPAGRIEVYVSDALERGIPGLEVHVEWVGNQDTFFTGLKSERSAGYGDFQMEANQIYTVTLVGLAEPVVGIDSAPCLTASGVSQIPTYQLVYAPSPPPEP